jgi:antitoxin VapB
MNARLPANALPAEAQKDSTVFTSGNSQAVRIPKEFQLKTKQVRIIQRNGELVIKPKYATVGELLASLPPVDDENPEEWDAFTNALQECRQDLLPLRDMSHLFTDAPAPRTGKRGKTTKVAGAKGKVATKKKAKA